MSQSPDKLTPRVQFSRCLRSLFLAGVVSITVGCANINMQQILTGDFRAPAHTVAEARAYRTKFQVEQDPRAFDWLLAHLVENGMTVAAISEVLGEDGDFYSNDQEMKTHGGQYQQTDVAYRWGPDNRGRSVVLFFRDGKLINFDPEDFRH